MQASKSGFVTSGSRGLDSLLEGGYRAGRVVQFFGKSNTGKSQIAMQAALCGARGGSRSLFVDTEGAFRPERVEQIAAARGWEEDGLLDRIVYLRCDSAAEQMETVRGMANRTATQACRLVVVDTITRNFSLDLGGGVNMQSRQEALNIHLSEMGRDAVLHGRTYVLTNRVTFGAGDSDVGIGGRTVEQLVHDSILLRRGGDTVTALSLGGRREAALGIGPLGID